MEESGYKIIINNYIKHLDDIVSYMKKCSAPQFKTLLIHCSDIDNKYQEWADTLTQSGVLETSRILYYFKIISHHNPNEISSKIKNYKLLHKKISPHYRALPRTNIFDLGYENDILYVGKSYNKFHSRFKHHLGLYKDHMFSLQLKYWAVDLDLKLELYYAIIEIDNKELFYLNEIEAALQYYMKPILGKTGKMN